MLSLFRPSISKLAPSCVRMFSLNKATVEKELNTRIETIKKRDPHQPEFLQAVHEVLFSISPLFQKYPNYLNIIPSICEPERVIQFKVPWLDRKGNVQVNRGFRVQFNSAIGPYKGGCRFHPSVNLSILKFLGYEQIFKNALTTLPMGGGKGGADFDPKGKNDLEVHNFCVSFMTELNRHIGQMTDIPAGDIGVGAREIGYMMGCYKRLTNDHQGGTLTGKGANWGGSLIRPEATGYGSIYFAKHAAESRNKDMKGLKFAISGSGNVAQFAMEKILDYGGLPLSLSDSNGFVYEPNGFNREQLKHVMFLKNVKRGRIEEYCKFSKTASFHPGRPWSIPCDVAVPSATQNEISGKDAEDLVKNGCWMVVEGANMPSDPEAITCYHKNNVMFLPAKAANAGGVAVSGLEMSQNSMRLKWHRDEVDTYLQRIMKDIWDNSWNMAEELGKPGDIQMGSNAAGFKKVADSMIELWGGDFE